MGVMPKNEAVIDVLPKNKLVEDILPKNLMGVGESLGDQLYTVVLGAGMPIGLLLTLTYPSAGTVQSSFSP